MLHRRSKHVLFYSLNLISIFLILNLSTLFIILNQKIFIFNYLEKILINEDNFKNISDFYSYCKYKPNNKKNSALIDGFPNYIDWVSLCVDITFIIIIVIVILL